MSDQFTPRLASLPATPRQLWPELRAVPRHFVLYGGTALALRLGHRQSADFDFFSSEPFQAAELLASLPYLQPCEVIQRVGNTLTVIVQREGPVKLSFFGGLTLGRVQDPEAADDIGLLVASLLDLAGTKAAVIQMRAEAKDYLDMLALLGQGISLPRALGAAQALYREQFNPMLTLKSLTYFADGDLHRLAKDQQQTLIEAVAATRDIAVVPRLSDSIAPGNFAEAPGNDPAH
jgi:hypothetical protein